MSTSLFRRSLGALVLSSSLILATGAAMAGTLGGVAGTVTDAKTGAPVSGAMVRIESGSQVVTVTTDSKGHYIAMSLQPDDYTISASKAGYQEIAVHDESVEADQTQQYDLQIAPSEPAQ
jgi:protocatechuate 3,4-dioxygenase beta subunit